MATLPNNTVSGVLGPQGAPGPLPPPWGILKAPVRTNPLSTGPLDPSAGEPNVFGNDLSLSKSPDPTAYGQQQINPMQTTAPSVTPKPAQTLPPPAPPTPMFGNVTNAIGQGAKPDPLQGTPLAGLGNLTTNYNDKTKDENAHKGIDVANAKGTPIPAAASGMVTKIQDENDPKNKGYGNNVIIKDAVGNFHRYSHLTGNYVKVGQPVSAGQTIGGMGSSGNSYSPNGGDPSHLDYRIQNAYGKYMNPFQYFKRFRR